MTTATDKPRILIADGDKRVLQLAKEIMESHDAEVVALSNGQDALHAASTSVFDLCVLGSDMPGMSGIEVCVNLRELPHTSNLPVLILTTDSNSVSDDALEAGGSDVLHTNMVRGFLWHRISLLLLISKLTKETQRLRETLPAADAAK